MFLKTNKIKLMTLACYFLITGVSYSKSDVKNNKDLKADVKSIDISFYKNAGIEKIGPINAPQFKLKSYSGKQVSLKDFKGTNVVLNFWATWCPPCKKEMPSLDKLHRKYHSQGLNVVAINDYENEKKVNSYMKNKDFKFTVLIDPSGKVSESYNAIALPITFIINKEGQAVGRVIGYKNWHSVEIQKFIEELLKN